MPSKLRDFKTNRQLGKGSYGTVYKVTRRSDGQEYALKEVNVSNLNQKEREEAINEVRILASLRDPNIIRYCEAFLEGDKLYIVTEYAGKGDIGRIIEKAKKRHKAVEEDVIWKHLIEICRGLQYLHDKQILHRDLKPKNIFLSKDERALVGDLGCAKLMRAGMARTQVGTPYYMSPEIWKNRAYGPKSDVWSVGAMIFEMASLRPPFLADDMKGLSRAVRNQPTPSVPGTYSQELKQLVRRLMAKAPESRPSIREVLAMPSVQARAERLCPTSEIMCDEEQPRILSTIKVPRYGRRLRVQLPKSSYPVRRLLQDDRAQTSPGKMRMPHNISTASSPGPQTRKLDAVNAGPKARSLTPPPAHKPTAPTRRGHVHATRGGRGGAVAAAANGPLPKLKLPTVASHQQKAQPYTDRSHYGGHHGVQPSHRQAGYSKAQAGYANAQRAYGQKGPYAQKQGYAAKQPHSARPGYGGNAAYGGAQRGYGGNANYQQRRLW